MTVTEPVRTRPPRSGVPHYHPIKPSATWAATVAAMVAERKNSAAYDARREAQKKRETVYATEEGLTPP